MHSYASLKPLPLIAEYNKWETLYIYEPFNIFPLFFQLVYWKKKKNPFQVAKARVKQTLPKYI